MANVDFAEIKSRHPIEEVARNMLGIVLKPTGAQLRAKCPLCNSDDPRHFAITPAKNAFYCFYEKKGGDALNLVSRLRGCTVREAAEAIAAHFGAGKTDVSPQPKQAERKTAFDAEKYLKTLEPEHEALSKLGVSAETLREWKTGYSASGVNRGRLALPVATVDGAIVGYMGMALTGEEPPLKFHSINPVEHLFGADRVKEGELTVVRDVMAVLTAAENGIDNCVCFLTETLCVEQFEVLVALMHAKGITSVSIF